MSKILTTKSELNIQVELEYSQLRQFLHMCKLIGLKPNEVLQQVVIDLSVPINERYAQQKVMELWADLVKESVRYEL